RRRAAAEGSACVGALAVLQENEADQRQRQNDMNQQYDRRKHASRFPLASLLFRRADNAQELLRLERSTTDEPTIDIRHCEKLSGVRGLHAAAIKKPYRVSNCNILRRENVTNFPVHFLRLVGAGGATGTDGPHRFVGN